VSRVKWEGAAALALQALVEAVLEWLAERRNRDRLSVPRGIAMGTYKAASTEELSEDAKGLAEEWARGLVESWGPAQALAMANHAAAELNEVAREAEKAARVEEQTLDLAGKRAPGTGG